MANTPGGGAATAAEPGLSPVRFPQLGESVVEGTVLQWLVEEGQTIEEDTLLCEIETEKVVAEIPSPFAGVVRSFAVEIGQTVPVGTTLLYIAAEGAAPAMAQMPGPTGATVPPVRTDDETDAMTASIIETNAEAEAPPAPTTEGTNGVATGATNAATNGASAPTYEEPADAGVRYSPAVRKLAREFGIDPGTVRGTGAGGRVTREDMMRANTEQQAAGSRQQAEMPAPVAATAPTPAAPAAAPRGIESVPERGVVGATPAPAAMPAGDLIPMTNLRRRTAEALTRATQTIPQAATWVEADVTDLVRRRDREKEAFKRREGVSLTFLPFFVQAALAAIRQYPVISSQWSDEGIRLKRQVGMGIAVSTDEGLVVPVIHNAGDYSITGLARVLDDKISRARANKLKLDDIQGSTITLTNPGSFGSSRTMAMVRPGEAAIYSVDAIVEKPVVWHGGIAIRSIVTIGLSWDHRIFDGREAVLFCVAAKKWLEEEAANVSL